MQLEVKIRFSLLFQQKLSDVQIALDGQYQLAASMKLSDVDIVKRRLMMTLLTNTSK